MPRAIATELPEHFWSKVEGRAGPECWEWTATRLPTGYGCYQFPRGAEIPGGGSRTRPAHRRAWELAHGEIPPGMRVCHRCDNPPCCNPAHLFLGTAKDNTRDMLAKARHCHGERHPRNVLSDADVREVRRLRTLGVTYDELERRFGVTRGALHRAAHGTSHRHVS